MKLYCSIIVLFTISIYSVETYSQTYLISQQGMVTTCSGTFYDSGGSGGNYSNNEDFTMTFKPATSGAKLQFAFSSFTLESHPTCNKDYFRIYDGENISAPQIGGDYCGTNSPGTVTATNTTGALTFVFHSNGSAVFSGWVATINCSIPINLGLWTGSTSVNWNIPSNWYNNFVPLAGTNVTIPSFATNWPTFTGNLTLGTNCNNITMDGSSELTVTGNLIISTGIVLTCNANSVINIGGNFTRNGVFNPGTGTVNFNGNTTSTVTGSPGILTIFNDGFESNTGWTLSGEFQRGAPLGLGGQSGNPDPSVAYAGLNVLGVDLTGLGTYPGDYEPSLPNRDYQAISPTINCSGYTNVALKFQRWLGVKFIDRAYIDISLDNGNTWTEIWYNFGAISQLSWSLETLDISAFANNQSQVKIRFCLGPTTPNQNYCGWNIDDFQINTNVSDLVPFYNLVNSKVNAELILNANVNVINNVDIKSDAYVTNSSGKVLYVGGNALLEANATGMASYIYNGTTNISGTTIVQQYLTSERWHSISPPISDATINVYYDVYLLEYHEVDNSWSYLVLPTTIPMNETQGYYAWVDDSWPIPSNPVSFEGQLNDAIDYPITLNYTTGAAKAGYNLVGNPYPCSLDWNTSSSWNRTNMSGWMTIKEGATYCGWNPYLNQGWNGKTDGIIPSTQGFWVRRLDGLPTTFTIPASERVHNSQTFYKNTIENLYPTIRLKVENDGISDESVVVFHPEGHTGFDGLYDLEKFSNGMGSPDIYTVIEEKEYAFNVMPEDYTNKVIPVYFRAGIEEICQLKSTEVVNFIGGIKVYLQDLKTGSVTILEENSMYEFEYSPLDDPHRFNLHFKDSYFGVDKGSPDSGIIVYAFENVININIPEAKPAEVAIYDMMGRELLQQKTVNENLTRIKLDAKTGYYIVKVQTGDQFVTKKIFIK
jgi:hypothetical protein